jgi:hypothetical protein
MFYPLSAAFKVNTEDIKSGRDFFLQVLQKTESCFFDLLPFFVIYCLKGISECYISPGLYLHKHDNAFVPGYDIDFAKNSPVIFLDNSESFFFSKSLQRYPPPLYREYSCPSNLRSSLGIPSTSLISF